MPLSLKKFTAFASVLALVFLLACADEDFIKNAPKTTLNLNPTGISGNQLTPEEQLGKVLFYDKALSANHAISCGSCHKQVFAFADNKEFSAGLEHLPTERNTPPLQNLGTFAIPLSQRAGPQQKLFWDGRAEGLHQAAVMPIFNHVEMGMDNTGELTQRIASRPYYQPLFEAAYGNNNISISAVSSALAAFISRLQAHDTPFDRTLNQTFGSVINPDNPNNPKDRGLSLFFGKYNCGSCHALQSPIGYNPTFNGPDREMVNIGLETEYADAGRAAITGKAEDHGKFKIPNLRNVELTAPYMHDGRFETLDEVIEHYSSAVRNNPNLDVRLKSSGGMPLKLNITAQEKADLIAFLKSLTSSDLISNPLYANPFVNQ
jgi:cytochrome c peroxidase